MEPLFPLHTTNCPAAPSSNAPRRNNPFSSPLVQSLPPFSECFAAAPLLPQQAAAALDIELAALLHPVALLPAGGSPCNTTLASAGTAASSEEASAE